MNYLLSKNPIPENTKKSPYKIPIISDATPPTTKNSTPKMKKVKIAVHSAEGPRSDCGVIRMNWYLVKLRIKRAVETTK